MAENKLKVATFRAELRKKILYFAASTRLFILLLSFLANNSLPDHNAEVFKFPKPKENSSFADEAVETMFGGLARWDAQYFMHISLYGYTYENTLAFFPLFPIITRIFGHLLQMIFGSMINTVSTVLVSAVAINFVFFVCAAMKLFDLSCEILKDDGLAYISALFFCVNPASIFFTAPYSESCFAFFTFSGMFILQDDNETLSSFAFGLASCTRSNGILNFGFITHKVLKNIVKSISVKEPVASVFKFIFTQLFQMCFYIIIFFAPFIIYQSYNYFQFCFEKMPNTNSDLIEEFGKSSGFITRGSAGPPWCNYTIPLSYSYVQSHYWSVGFLRYYKLKQIPNFLLAFPIIFVVVSNSYLFLGENRNLLMSLGLNNGRSATFRNRQVRPEFFVFVVHALFLVTFCTLFIHVQVATRLIASSCPVLYWFVALRYMSFATISDRIQSRLKELHRSQKYSVIETQRNLNSYCKTIILTEKLPDKWLQLVTIYFCSYLVLGTILFSNFLPWT